MGGIINIVTTRPGKLEASILGGYGSDDTYKYGASIGNRWDRFSARVGYEAETTDGYSSDLVAHSIFKKTPGPLSTRLSGPAS